MVTMAQSAVPEFRTVGAVFFRECSSKRRIMLKRNVQFENFARRENSQNIRIQAGGHDIL